MCDSVHEGFTWTGPLWSLMIKIIFKHNQTANRAEKKIAPVCGFLRSDCGKIAPGLRIRISQKISKCKKIDHDPDPDQDYVCMYIAWRIIPDQS